MSEEWKLIIWGIVLFFWFGTGLMLTEKVILSKKKGCATFFIMLIISVAMGGFITNTVEMAAENRGLGSIPFAVYIVSIICSYIYGLTTKCSECGKPFALELVNKELLQMGEMFYKKDKEGKRVLVQRNLYMEHYRCKFCESEFEKKVTEDEAVD